MEALQLINRIILSLSLLVCGTGLLAGWWTVETPTFQALALMALAVLVMKGDG